jgi:hypothetical protein
MFVQHKQLEVLNVPASRIARLNTSASSVQLAFPGFAPQLAASYLMAVSRGDKVLIVVAFFLSESKHSIFFVPQQGEVSVEKAEAVFNEGFVFAESMGFILGETDFHLLSNEDQQKLWQSLPICQKNQSSPNKKTASAPLASAETAGSKGEDELENYRQRSLRSLGRFLASM